jgi:hypothetical protein
MIEFVGKIALGVEYVELSEDDDLDGDVIVFDLDSFVVGCSGNDSITLGYYRIFEELF